MPESKPMTWATLQFKIQTLKTYYQTEAARDALFEQLLADIDAAAPAMMVQERLIADLVAIRDAVLRYLSAPSSKHYGELVSLARAGMAVRISRCSRKAIRAARRAIELSSPWPIAGLALGPRQRHQGLADFGVQSKD